jgi:hypothetical protein
MQTAALLEWARAIYHHHIWFVRTTCFRPSKANTKEDIPNRHRVVQTVLLWGQHVVDIVMHL